MSILFMKELKISNVHIAKKDLVKKLTEKDTKILYTKDQKFIVTNVNFVKKLFQLQEI